MGMATYIEQSINNALTHYVVTSSDAVIAVLTPVAVTAVTTYVMWTGFQVMRGDVQEPVSALVWRWFRVAIIAGLALNGPQYRSLVAEGLEGLQQAFASAFGGVLSMGRLSAVLFPMFLWLGAAIPPRHRSAWLFVFGLGQALVAVLFFTWRQVF